MAVVVVKDESAMRAVIKDVDQYKIVLTMLRFTTVPMDRWVVEGSEDV